MEGFAVQGFNLKGSVLGDFQQIQDGFINDDGQTVAMFYEFLEHMTSCNNIVSPLFL
jgi:hypothetical protein